MLVGALVSAFLLASCSGGDKSKAPVVSTADIENAAEVIKYYNTSLGVLKDMVKEKDVNAVLDYMEQKGKPRLFLPLFLRPLFQKTRQ